jgi:hypothetical protein
MAQRVITQLVDDLDGTEIKDGKGETVAFSLDGKSYAIDLTTKNADNFRGVFQNYIAVARTASKGRSIGNMKKATGPTAAEIRAWASANGHKVPDRGRVAAEVKDAYAKAH